MRTASTRDDPYPNAFRYRIGVQSLNEDMAVYMFLKAQLRPICFLFPIVTSISRSGFYGLSRIFKTTASTSPLGIHGAHRCCAQCHDHKYDPIPTTDFYALQGVFSSTTLKEYRWLPRRCRALAEAERPARRAGERAEGISQTGDWQVGEILAGRFRDI